MIKKDIIFVLAVFILWQVLIAGIIFLGQRYIPSSLSYLYTEKRVVNLPLLWSRANFDGIHYLDIARKGYGIYQQAFFPLYPRLINLLTPVFDRRDLVAGWFISLVNFFLGLVLLVKLVKLDYEEKVARWTLIFLLSFPTAFFFSMVYTESLFLFLILASFYFARTKKWWLAGIFGALASATRLVGIFLLPALLVEWWEQQKVRGSKFAVRGKLNHSTIQPFSHLLAIGLIPLGLLWYMRFLQIKFGDPLMFFRVQPYFGAGRAADKIILLHQVSWRYLKMLWTVEKTSLIYFVVVLEFLTGLGFLGLLGLACRKKVRPSYLVFAILSYLAPTLTGTFSSMPRYVLTLFPCFIMMALIENRLFRALWLAVSGLLLVICTILFSQGYWIA